MRTRNVGPFPLFAGLLALSILVGTARAQSADQPILHMGVKTHTVRTSREQWRRAAIGRWVSERGADAFLILSRDGKYEAGFYKGTHPIINETGTYVVTPDGSVTVTMQRLDGLKMDGGGGTYYRQGDALHAAIGPTPWVRWHKETGPHHPLVLPPQPHLMP